MAITNFRPEVWSAELLVNLQSALVFGSDFVVNRDYEGDINGAGDSVKILNLVPPTIGTYTPHTDITVEDVDDAARTLLVDQSKYFAFEVDDVEASQLKGTVIATQTQEAAYGLRSVADTFVANLISAAVVGTANQLPEDTLSTPEEAYDKLVDLRTRLDESEAPEDGRFAVVTPKFEGLLIKDQRFIAAGDAAGATVRANGRVGAAAGFTVLKSNRNPDGPGAGAGKQVVAGNRKATTFADAIVETEAQRMEKRFADLVKGLHVYGAKVIRPEFLAAADVVIP